MSDNPTAFQIIKPRNVLSDLPFFVKERIVRFAHPVVKLSLQQCSKDFKTIVERSPKQISMIYIDVEGESVHCDVGIAWLHQKAQFDREDDYGYDDVREAVRWFRHHVPSRVHVTLGQLIINMSSGLDREFVARIGEKMGLLMRNFQQTLSTRRYKLSVNKFSIEIRNSELEILKVLPYLEPGALESIRISTSSSTRISLDTVVELEQWKQAKKLMANIHSSFTFDQLKHFEEATIWMSHLTIDMVRDSVQHFISTPGVKSLEISLATADSAPIRFFLRQYGPATMEKQRVECPGTEEFVEIETQRRLFAVRRLPIEIVQID